MRNYSKVLKIAPAFLLAGTIMLEAQEKDQVKEKEIEQVVLIGYGKQKKSDLTGSITALSDKDFNKGAIVNTQQMLQGKTAGVTINSNGGQPGSGATVRIRGISSLNGNTDPLYVIDGIPLDRSGIAGSPNPLNAINPNDIESISILKDASATAIYGARASAGVIIISTKKGTKGGWKFNYSGSVQQSEIMDKFDVFTGDEIRAMVNELLPLKVQYLGTANTDWQDLIYQKAFGMTHDFSARGNLFNTTPFRASIGYSNIDGVLKTSNFDRLSTGFGLNPKFLNGDLAFNINAKGTLTNYQYAPEGAIGQAIAMDPTQDVYSDKPLYTNYGGFFQWIDSGTNRPYANVGLRNPIATINGVNNKAEVKQFIGNTELEYKMPFMKELSAVANVALEYSEAKKDNKTASYLSESLLEGFEVENQIKNNQNLDLYFRYIKNNFSSGVLTNLGITGGYNYQSFLNHGTLLTNNMTEANPYREKGVIISFFGRTNLTFVDKYLLTMTVRREASSRFAEDVRWGTFPSASFAWQMKKEDWLSDSKFFSDLKMRLGWGVTGNQEISGWYPAVSIYSLENSDLARYITYPNGITATPVYVKTINPLRYNSKLKWEETTQYNVGFDYGIFKRLTGSVDIWQKDIRDLLYITFLPAGANLDATIESNVASMNSKGLDFDINAKLINKSKVKFDLGFNIGFVDMEITKLNKQGNIDTNVGRLNGLVDNPFVQAFTVGYIPYEYYLYKQVYDTNGKPIEGVVADINGDGKITEDDKYHSGVSPIADYTYGFNTNLEIGNFDLKTVWRGSQGNYAFNNINARYSTLKFVDSDGFTAINNTVTNLENTNFQNPPGVYQMASDLYLEDASFLKLDNVTLGYTFNNFFKTNSRVRLYGSVQNVFTISDYSGLDPEVGIDWNMFPRSRTYLFGLNVDF